MNLTDSWKAFRVRHKHGSPFPITKKFTDMIAFDMTNHAKVLHNKTQDDETYNVMINESISVSNKTITSSLTPDDICSSKYTKRQLGKKQVQFI